MGDLISRADAIKAVEQEYKIDRGYMADDYTYGFNQAIQYVSDIILHDLPSAEPSGDLISRQWLLDLYDIDTTNFKETAKVPLEVVIQNIKDAPTIEPIEDTKSCGVEELNTLPSAEPSGDLISRKEVHKVLSLLATEGGKDAKLLFSDAHEFIDALPSADRPQVNSNSAEEQIAETCDRPKGEWLDVEHEPFCECSVCGAYIENLDDDFAFCPRCGADMRPEK